MADLIVNPWKVEGKLTNDKYDQLVNEFGVQKISSELLDRFCRVTKCEKPHRLLRRGLFFAHRDLELILDDLEQGKQIFIYTGRGPTSEALHLGHIVPIEFTAWLQKTLDAIVVFQMADDEKYWFKDLEFDQVYQLGFKNARDIIALGFNPDKTFMFSSRDYTSDRSYQKVTFDIMKKTTTKSIKAIFGIEDEGCVGQLMWPAYQTAAAFSEAFEKIFMKKQARCLVAYAIDQDPYFRMARDVAPKLGYIKPSSIMSRFLPALEGDAKMSSTGNNGPVKTIFLTDSEKEVKDKINKYAFSGGKDTVEEHRKYGGDLQVDVCYQWLKHFLEDDAELEEIAKKYASGEMLTGELKAITIKAVNEIIKQHREAREAVTDEIVARFYDITKFNK